MTPIFFKNLQQLRLKRMLSRAELATRAEVSVTSIARMENGELVSFELASKVLKALGYSKRETLRILRQENNLPKK
jgi:transcriptional regulator with XRE-family HTH domain